VYFDLSSGVTVLSSAAWNFTNCQDVPLSGFAPLDLWATATLEIAATPASANNPIDFVFISTTFHSNR